MDNINECYFLGKQHEIKFYVTMDDQIIFSQLSGDKNPLHLNSDYAISRGFEDAVVYGGLILAKISQLIGMTFPGINGFWTGIKLDFRNALYICDEATLYSEIVFLSESSRSMNIKIEVRSADKKIATGIASVSLFANINECCHSDSN